jgi:hypothetical protein
MKIKIKLIILFGWIWIGDACGQMTQFTYQRTLSGASEQWHKVVLPSEIFSKTSQNLADLRVFGIAVSGDTLEVPYLMYVARAEVDHKNRSFRILNTVNNERGYFFTFETPTVDAVNQLKLDFKQKNFDWRVRLEGSNNQQEWFTLLEDYRILSLQDGMTTFEFTLLKFPTASYRFFRLAIDSKDSPELLSASMAHREVKEGMQRRFPVKQMTIEQNKASKQTTIDIDLPMPTRVSQLELTVEEDVDFYRPLSIQYLSDSVSTPKGWHYTYTTLYTGTLQSIQKNEFQFEDRTLQKLKILITNQDNLPLSIADVTVKGHEHELWVRLPESTSRYYLAYGNPLASQPSYDLSRFTDKVPLELIPLEVGPEEIIDKEKPLAVKPLFQDPKWLWAVLVFSILVMGWFTVKMMGKK